MFPSLSKFFRVVFILVGAVGGLCTVLLIVGGVFLTIVIPFTNSVDLLQKAERGEVSEQRRLGIAYESGKMERFSLGMIRKDTKKAIYWYTRAAMGGHTVAGYALAKIYFRDHTPTSDALAVQWFTQSAEAGYVGAASALSDIYAYGLLGQPVDSQKAAYWEKRAVGVYWHDWRTLSCRIGVDDQERQGIGIRHKDGSFSPEF